MSKKIKGTKMDLATFVATTPAPKVSDVRPSFKQDDRQNRNDNDNTGDRFRGGNRFIGDREKVGGDDSTDRRDESSEAPWSRVGSDRNNSTAIDNSVAQTDSNWRKSSGTSYSSNRQSGGAASSSNDTGYKRISLAPRTGGTSQNELSFAAPADNAPVSSPAESNTDPSLTDKWANVFNKSVSISQSNRRQPTNESFRDGPRGGGWGVNRGGERDGGFGDRGGYPRSGDGGGDRGGYQRGDGGGYGGDRGFQRGSERGGYRPGGRSGPSDEVDDPRFAGKFSSGGGDRERPSDRGGYRDRDRPTGDRGGYRERSRYNVAASADEPLPSAPRAVRGSEGSSEQQLPAHLQKLTAEVTREAGIAGASAEQKAAEDAKNSKAAKAQAREEADRRSKETKEAAALREKELALQREAQMTNVANIVQSTVDENFRGSELLDKLLSSALDEVTEEDRRGILGTVLMKVAIEKCGLEDVASSKWWTKDQFGSALSGLLEGRFSAQVAALYIVQGYCERHKFPASVGGKSGKLIEQLFNILLSAQVIEPEGFFAWADDEAGADSPGRLEAVVQTSGFLLKLKELLQDEIGDEEEEVDRPREIVK